MSALDEQVGGDHYKKMPIQPLELMRIVMSDEEFRGYLRGSIIKYAMRAGHKADTDDKAKAMHYAKILEEFDGGML